MPSTRFAAALEEARGSGRVLLDLTESDPARCGLGWDAGELDGSRDGGDRRPGRCSRRRARRSPATWPATAPRSHPHRVFLVRSRREALRLVLDTVCGRGGEVLVPVPHRPLLESGSSVRLRRYPLVFEERWRIDRRSIQRAIAPTTRAIVVGNPADPTGRPALARGARIPGAPVRRPQLALVADESFLDSSLEPGPSVAAAGRRLTVHVSGLGGICGLPQLDAAWVAVGGPEALAAPLASRLATLAGAADSGARRACCSLPPLLGRREVVPLAPARRGSPGTAPRWRPPRCARRPGRCSGAVAGGPCSR